MQPLRSSIQYHWLGDPVLEVDGKKHRDGLTVAQWDWVMCFLFFFLFFSCTYFSLFFISICFLFFSMFCGFFCLFFCAGYSILLCICLAPVQKSCKVMNYYLYWKQIFIFICWCNMVYLSFLLKFRIFQLFPGEEGASFSRYQEATMKMLGCRNIFEFLVIVHRRQSLLLKHW